MPSKRQILAELSRDELVEIVDRHDLAPRDRRSRDALVDAVASSKKATLEEILPALARDRLKELCRTFGLDDGGREKDGLVARLLGQANAAAGNGVAARAGATNKASERASDAAPPADLLPGEVLTRERLERYLWSAADILRGSIDSSDYKGFIFGLLFLKRLSDRFEEECEALVASGEDPEERDNHQFYVPKRARWPELQKVATGLGDRLNTACLGLEEANASLDGVLAGIDFNDERKLGDTKSRDNVLTRLVQHFSRINLRNANLSEPDLLGRAYEYLIERFADDAGKKGGEFYTPKKVVELIVALLDPREGMRVCDPTCGSGGMLIESAAYLRRTGQNPKNLSLYGQEKNLGTWAICKMNMLLHGLTAFIEKGDTIRDPKLLKDGELMLFDRVIANPPFSLDDWGREAAEHDPFGRFRFGVPPRSKGDLAFLQHMIATVNVTGMVGVVMPHGVLFRGSAEGDIRKGFIEEDLVEGVIGLPTNLFYGTGIPAVILILNRSKPLQRKDKVIFIDASRGFRPGTTQNFLRDEDITTITDAFRRYSDQEKYARVVAREEIRRTDWTLNISRYVDAADTAQIVDVASALTRLRELEKARALAETKMNVHLAELGYGQG